MENMQPLSTITSRVVVLPLNDIDTDQIIPARYLKATDKHGMGANLFADWRYRPDGSPNPDFILNQPGIQGAQVLLAGNNFGCGSSREHAPWALAGFGFKAVIATSFGDIFYNNALKNGLLPVTVDASTHQMLRELFEEAPRAELTIDLANQAIIFPGGHAEHFPLNAFSKACLLQGTDELGYLLGMQARIRAFENSMDAQA
jgi:3-isopropylmalate/(R)-2-methylmalate dehydratase small subunit